MKNGLVLTDENFDYIDSIGIIATYLNIVKYLNSKNKIDKEGLIKYNPYDNISSYFQFGYIYNDDYYLMAHRYFRRGYFDKNTYRSNFIREFWSLKDRTINKLIAIDFDRICIKLNAGDDLDVYFGAAFNKDIALIPDSPVKLVTPEKYKINKYNIYSLDIKWKTQNGNRVFEAEEFRTTDIKLKVDDIEYFPVRYIHSVFNNEHKCFDHFDGAIHLYSA